MDRGKFVPDAIIFEVLEAAVEREKGRGKHIMLDGFPRYFVIISILVCVYLLVRCVQPRLVAGD